MSKRDDVTQTQADITSNGPRTTDKKNGRSLTACLRSQGHGGWPGHIKKVSEKNESKRLTNKTQHVRSRE